VVTSGKPQCVNVLLNTGQDVLFVRKTNLSAILQAFLKLTQLSKRSAKRKLYATIGSHGRTDVLNQMPYIGTLTGGRRFLVEHDGPHHFIPAYWWENGADLQDQLSRDLAKNRYAQQQRISLLRISCEGYREIEYWVNKFYQPISKESRPGLHSV